MELFQIKGERGNRPIYKESGWGFFFAMVFQVGYIIIIPTYVAPALWPKHIESPYNFAFLWSIGVHEAAWLVANLTLWLIYHLQWDFFERYKCNEFEWPWNVDKPKWIEFLKQTLYLVFFNQFVMVPILLVIFMSANGGPSYRVDYESLPSSFDYAIHMGVSVVLDDFLFYLSHRFLHWRKIYPYFHKIHHRYNNTIGVAAEYAHPVEFVFGNVIPQNFGAMILGKRTHALCIGMQLFMKILATTETHSGYSFSFSPWRYIFYNRDFHNYHHSEGFGGNFGNSPLWDWVFGTLNKNWVKKFKLKKGQKVEDEEEEEKTLSDKSAKKLD